MLLLLAWGIADYFFSFPDPWRRVTGTASGTLACLMVFTVWYTQRRNTVAMHRRLDDLLCAVNGAHERSRVGHRMSLSPDEQAALSTGSGPANEAMSFRPHGEQTPHLWLVPPPGCRDTAALTPRCINHDAGARKIEKPTQDF
jgi:hypothetical protein